MISISIKKGRELSKWGVDKIMMYGKVFVAVLDILGFKNLILHNSREEAERIIDDFKVKIESSCSGGKGLLYNTNPICMTVNSKEFKLNFNLFSDSVVVWTNNYSLKEFIYLIITTKNLLNSTFKYGLPLRGAISEGYLQVNPFDVKSDYLNFENVIYGDSMVKAFILEKKQIWSGCIIDPKIKNTDDIQIKNFLNAKSLGKFYCRYNVPIRKKGCVSLLAINWVTMEEDSLSEEIIRGSFSKFNKKSQDYDVDSKIINTIKFYKYVKNLKVIENNS